MAVSVGILTAADSGIVRVLELGYISEITPLLFPPSSRLHLSVFLPFLLLPLFPFLPSPFDRDLYIILWGTPPVLERHTKPRNPVTMTGLNEV